MTYDDDNILSISGIQHFVFCRRQWALIHIEQQWEENLLTVEGNIFHEKAHDKGFTEVRDNIIISRAMPICSAELGITGECDVVEFHKDNDGIELFGREGKYHPYPIEYKKGRPKAGDEDALQLTAQAMCLEEMLYCTIDHGYLFYGETKHRVKVVIGEKLRKKVIENLTLMHQYYKRRYTPDTKSSKKCKMCSIKDICLPERNRYRLVRDYISESLEG